jgi:hypothetical protein
VVIHPLRSTRSTAAISSSVMSGRENGIGASPDPAALVGKPYIPRSGARNWPV